MDWILKFIYELPEKWTANFINKVIILFVLYLAIFTICLPLCSTLVIAFIAASLVYSTIVLFIIIISRPPVAKKRRIGIIFAIEVEKEQFLIKLKNDFIETFSDRISKSKLKDKFEVLIYPNYLSKVVDVNNAEKYLNKSQSAFIIYGIMKERIGINNKTKYIFKIEGGVKHQPLPKEISSLISNEFKRVFEENFEVPITNDYEYFEMYGEVFQLIAFYMLGLVSIIALRIDYGIELLTEVLNRVQVDETRYNSQVKKIYSQSISKLRANLPFNVFQAYISQVQVFYEKWYQDRDKEHLKKALVFADKAGLIDNKSYVYNNFKSIVHFALDRNIDLSLHHITMAGKTSRDGTWLYNKGFIEAYGGNLDSAHFTYMKAFESNTMDESVPIQSEIFITEIIDEEADKKYLHYALGLINLYPKSDPETANNEFEIFIAEYENDANFTNSVNRAKKFIERIQSSLS